MKNMLAILGFCCILATPAWAGSWAKSGSASNIEMDRVVHAVCRKEIVLLGEDSSHAGATTIAVKVRLVKRLVNECGFRGVVFESQFYDMLNFEHDVADGSATRQQLADAVGAVWSRYPSFAPLMDWLFRETDAGRVHVAGMDPQVGGVTAYYSQKQLPADLSSVLVGTRRTECESIISRHDRWEYDDSHPFGAVALRHLRSCLRDIDHWLEAMEQRASPSLRAMANSYTNYLRFAGGGGRGRRDRAMYENLKRIRARWPNGTRVIIWCASVHAAKSLKALTSDMRPLGSYVHKALGTRAAAIGFSALTGSYGHVGGHGMPRSLSAVASDSLEACAFASGAPGALHFLDQAQLKAMGKVPARALAYGKSHTLDWSKLFDGIIVLRKEIAAVAKP
ncbi:MAG TPA: erythromycin esterase family protein [Oleiagrimonas sp.]|nr:erythromycin esterase family protein [Oleiagrimonas sp.]